MTESSFAPRFTTMLILIGASPAAAAASMPLSTSETGKSASFILRNTASSSESRLTVTRVRPAAGQADFLDSVTFEDARQPCDLLEAQQLALREKRVVGAEHVARHAVDAAEVATVSDRDAQVVQPAAEPVLPRALRSTRFPLGREGV